MERLERLEGSGGDADGSTLVHESLEIERGRRGSQGEKREQRPRQRGSREAATMIKNKKRVPQRLKSGSTKTRRAKQIAARTAPWRADFGQIAILDCREGSEHSVAAHAAIVEPYRVKKARPCQKSMLPTMHKARGRKKGSNKRENQRKRSEVASYRWMGRARGWAARARQRFS